MSRGLTLKMEEDLRDGHGGGGRAVRIIASSVCAGARTRNSSVDLILSSILDKEVLRDDAPSSVVGVVTSVTLSSRVSNLPRREGSRFQSV